MYSVDMRTDASTYECLFGLDECNANAVCTDTEESYSCACLPGFSGNGFKCTSMPNKLYLHHHL